MPEPDDTQELRAKLDALKGALDRRNAEKRAAAAGGPSESERAAQTSAISRGYAAAGEFAASVVLGGLIGWQCDRWLGTKPAFLIAFFLIGAAAGVWSLIRAASPKVLQSDRNSRLSHAEAADKDGRRAAPAAGQNAPGGTDDDDED
jgi:ATP synthase protein I